MSCQAGKPAKGKPSHHDHGGHRNAGGILCPHRFPRLHRRACVLGGDGGHRPCCKLVSVIDCGGGLSVHRRSAAPVFLPPYGGDRYAVQKGACGFRRVFPRQYQGHTGACALQRRRGASRRGRPPLRRHAGQDEGPQAGDGPFCRRYGGRRVAIGAGSAGRGDTPRSRRQPQRGAHGAGRDRRVRQLRPGHRRVRPARKPQPDLCKRGAHPPPAGGAAGGGGCGERHGTLLRGLGGIRSLLRLWRGDGAQGRFHDRPQKRDRRHRGGKRLRKVHAAEAAAAVLGALRWPDML